MAERVFVHLGLPKTGTSYLQAIVWPQREALAGHGLLLPGAAKNDHLFASMIVRDDPGVARRGASAPGAWDRIRDDVAGFAGDALISHEFFCSATAEQAQRMVAQLASAEVHLVITAREPLGLFTSSWQESLKNVGTTPLSDYGRSESTDPRDVWDWRALDLGLVLQRWTTAVSADRIHVLTPPPAGAPRSVLWERFAGVLGVDPALGDAESGFANASMGVVEAETLRRLNAVLPPYNARQRGRWLRSFLADDRLVPRGGDKFWPSPDQIEDCRRRGERAVAMLRAAPYDVVGEASALLVPDELEPRRHPDSVTDAEVAACALDLVASLMEEIRGRPEPVPAPTRARRGIARIGSRRRRPDRGD